MTARWPEESRLPAIIRGRPGHRKSWWQISRRHLAWFPESTKWICMPAMLFLKKGNLWTGINWNRSILQNGWNLGRKTEWLLTLTRPVSPILWQRTGWLCQARMKKYVNSGWNIARHVSGFRNIWQRSREAHVRWISGFPMG